MRAYLNECAGKGKDKKGNWKAKYKLIEDINELLEELDNITSSITSQVRRLSCSELCTIFIFLPLMLADCNSRACSACP